jgi:hypothetical protein
MRRTSTRALRLAIALAAPAALIGCGDDDDTSDSSAATVGAPDTTQAAAASASGPPSTPVQTSAPVPTSAPAQTSAPAASDAVATTAAGAGVTYTSPQGDYSAVFPVEPTEQTQPTQLPDGSVMRIVIVGVERDDLFIATARGRYPKGTVLDLPGALEGAQQQAIANVQGQLITSRDIELQGRPGREFSASLTSNGEAGTLLQRVYFDGSVIYQNIVTGAGELTFQDPAAAAFFESFRFTQD